MWLVYSQVFERLKETWHAQGPGSNPEHPNNDDNNKSCFCISYIRYFWYLQLKMKLLLVIPAFFHFQTQLLPETLNYVQIYIMLSLNCALDTTNCPFDTR